MPSIRAIKAWLLGFLVNTFFTIFVSLGLHRLFWGRDSSRSGPSANTVTIRGLGTEWPTASYGTVEFDEYVRSHYLESAPGIQRTCARNQRTGIKSRNMVLAEMIHERGTMRNPTMEEGDEFFREKGTALAFRACQKAIKEWGGLVEDITHVVAVTCTNAGSPGFDLALSTRLNLPVDVDRTLISGVGCAGGMAMMRVAQQIARGGAQLGRPARILAVACELTSIQSSVELEDAESNDDPSIGPILFSDGAAAFMLCNALDTKGTGMPIYEVIDQVTRRTPDTDSLISYRATSKGFKLHLSRNIGVKAKDTILPGFFQLLSSLPRDAKCVKPRDFDWALHPGGKSIIDGAESAMALAGDELRATRDIYTNHGNTSSVSVLAVLDRLRHMGDGRDFLMAVAFGPGLSVEMGSLRRVRAV